ncbi:MAG: GHKL domain-containing protein [Bacteroidetes bacterium]|nr:GHKL domain-containing protein [Bacteroidota bacterium]
MDFNWRSPMFTRLAILAATVFALGFILANGFNFTVSIALLIAIAFQVKQLLEIFEQPNAQEDLSTEKIKFDETTQSFKTENGNEGAKRFCSYLNESLNKLKLSRREKDSEHQFFKNIVQHVGIGILTFDDEGVIQIINTAAKRLLKVERAEKLDDLLEVDSSLVESFKKLKTGGRELLQLKTGDETVQLSFFAIELTLRGKPMKLISMSNIQTELEEKEMKAWQDLVRVLTHEIMNSVTPISSLATVVEGELDAKIKKAELQLQKEEAEDMHLSLQTISKRSAGLIRFVKEFKNLTHVPKPRLAEVEVKCLLEELAMLHKKELADHGITVELKLQTNDLKVSADKTMIEQVLINLIKNAIQAFDSQLEKKILLSAHTNEGHVIISVKDNGNGIDADALEKIFIPFFTTKKTGSGIGLSLSRQIMRQHGGQISVKSKLGEGTEFVLRF